MFNGKICRDCDKVGECIMKCAALKRLEIPYIIKLSSRGHGRAQNERGLLKLLSDAKRGLIAVDDTKYEIIPRYPSGVAIAFDVCGRGQVLSGIVKIKQTEDELIFIDSQGRENHIAKKLIDVMEVIT